MKNLITAIAMAAALTFGAVTAQAEGEWDQRNELADKVFGYNPDPGPRVLHRWKKDPCGDHNWRQFGCHHTNENDNDGPGHAGSSTGDEDGPAPAF